MQIRCDSKKGVIRHGITNNHSITVLSPGCVWRIKGNDSTHLLRHERGAITVFDESYGSQQVNRTHIDRIGFVYRRRYPTFMVEADGVTYGIPAHGIELDHIHGTGFEERELIQLIGQAYAHNIAVELDVRRSTFRGMDGSQDDFQAVIEGVRLG